MHNYKRIWGIFSPNTNEVNAYTNTVDNNYLQLSCGWIVAKYNEELSCGYIVAKYNEALKMHIWDISL